MAASAICISRTIGALGEDVGRLVAERLGFRYVDEEIVSRAAARENVDPDLVADVERRRSLVERLLSALAAGGADAYVGQLPADATGESDHYRALIRETIEEVAAQGDVVLVAHAASYALSGHEDLLRVLVTASPEVRGKRLEPNEDAAEKAVRKSDEARADYLRRFYDVDQEYSVHYDLVVNTDRLSADQAATIVADAAAAI